MELRKTVLEGPHFDPHMIRYLWKIENLTEKENPSLYVVFELVKVSCNGLSKGRKITFIDPRSNESLGEENSATPEEVCSHNPFLIVIQGFVLRSKLLFVVLPLLK